jgi:putative SOS response-associated peptidase YedK
MCGRFSLHHPVDEIHDRFAVQHVLFTQPPRYNIAPTQPVAVVTPRRELTSMKWGLVPSWSRDGRPFFNARGESLAEKPAFRHALRSRRVLVPCSGFWEWRTEGRQKLPVHIRFRDGRLFAMAGLWEGDPAGVALVTVAANAAVSPVHDRMPAILAPQDEAGWLDPRHPAPEALLRPFPAEEMEFYAVSPRVNGPRDDDAALLDPA